MSDNNSADRPRPQYGEYSSQERKKPQFGELATPEEQRAAIRVPATDDNESVPIENHGTDQKYADENHPHEHHTHEQKSDQQKTGNVESRSHQRSQMNAHPHPAPKPAAPDDDAAVNARQRTDRVSTYILLGVGLVSVLTTAPSLIQLPQMLTQGYAQFGMGEYTNDSVGTMLGWVILVLYAALWVVALFLSLRRLAAQKTTWWVPFVIGVAANLLYIILLTVAMVSDPAFMQYVNGMTTGASS